jgi:hypothetical protein
MNLLPSPFWHHDLTAGDTEGTEVLTGMKGIKGMALTFPLTSPVQELTTVDGGDGYFTIAVTPLCSPCPLWLNRGARR